MAPIRDGDFYIQNSNQDFWLRENGVWVRKGNIRDEGTSGLVGIQPIIGVGLVMGAQVDRTRFLGSIADDLGIDMAALVSRIRLLAATHQYGAAMNVILDRIRQVAPAGEAMGYDMSVIVQVLPTLIINITPAPMDMGFLQTTAISRIRELTAANNYGWDVTVVVDRTRYLGTVSDDMGVTQTATVDRIKALAATSALGFNMAASIDRIKAIAAAVAEGFSVAAAVTRTRPVTASLDQGFAMASAVTHSAQNQFIVVSDTASPFLRVFNSSLTKFTDPSTLPSNGIPTSCAATTGRFAIARTTQVYVYDVTSSAVTINTTLTITSGAGTQFMKFSADGTRLMVITRGTSPYITIFNTSTWSSVTAPVPGQVVNAADFSTDGATIAVALNASPFLKLYRTSDMTAITSPSTLPSAASLGVSYSPNGSHFAVVISGTTNDTINVYRTSDLGLATTLTLAGHVGNSGGGYPVWSGDGLEFACGSNSTPYLSVWSRSGDTFTAQTLGASQPGASYATYLSVDGLTMFTVCSGGTGFMNWDKWTRSSGGTNWTRQLSPPANQPGGSDILCVMAGTL